MVNMIRKPAVAGQFYEGTQKRLEERIKDCFLDKRGPNKLPIITKGDKKIIGVVVPHAGYIYSGAIAANSFMIIAENGFADTFIILGPNHTGFGSGVSAMMRGKWETPLGMVKINEEIGKKLCTGIIENDENAHIYEHSIEVQLPFLQFIGKENFDFVPICMSMQDEQTSKEVGKIISHVINKSNNNIVLIASTDFSHVGFNYSSMPPAGIRVDQYAEEQDKKAIEKIIQMKPDELIDTVHKNNITMCGFGPVAAMVTAANELGAKKAELLKYGTSYEVHPGSSCVGYVAISIY
jgi:AmmeMemoRadiSam system protein B